MRSFVALLAVVLAASPAAAQTYVGASLVGDITRFSHVDAPGAGDAGGEAIGVGLRAGTSITDVFGVELEFVRPSVIESSIDMQVLPALDGPVIRLPEGTPLFPELILPPIRSQLRSETRNTTVAASLWARQTLTGRLALVYSGGLALVRSHQEVRLDYQSVGGILPPRVPVPLSVATEAVRYSMQPQVGVEARIGMTEHVELVPALRMHGLENGWTLRPSVGLGWIF